MPRRAGDRSSEVGLYIRELRLSLRNNSGAFGYSVMITCTMAMLTSIAGSPRPAHIVLFVLAAVASFALIEVVATRAFTRSLEDEHTTVIALDRKSVGVGNEWRPRRRPHQQKGS